MKAKVLAAAVCGGRDSAAAYPFWRWRGVTCWRWEGDGDSGQLYCWQGDVYAADALPEPAAAVVQAHDEIIAAAAARFWPAQ